MAGGSGEAPQYVGPDQLQQIANNNNRRIQQTGDATPVTIGHTEDGRDEDEQPEIVGWATNFSVGPLFDTGLQALFADFHVRKDEKDRINKYFPRRSVEFWPKRMEVDPISLLGATTPEQDLGLLQFARRNEVVRMDPRGEVIHYSRRGEVIRYSRSLDPEDTTPISRYGWGVSDLPDQLRRYAAKSAPKCQCCDPSCPCCAGKCGADASSTVHRTDMDDEEGTPMCPGCTEDALSSGIFRSGVSHKKQEPSKAPKPEKKSRTTATAGATSMAGHSFPTPIRATPPYRVQVTNGKPRRYAADGSDGGAPMGGGGGGDPQDDQTAQLVQAVLQSAPIQEIVQGQKQSQEQMSEIMQMLQQMGGEGQEGKQPGPEGAAGAGLDGGAEDEGSPDGAPPQEEARWEHEGPPKRGTMADVEGGPADHYEDDDMPEQYMEMDDDEESSDVQPKKYGGAYASSTNVSIPGENFMGGHRKPPQRKSRSAGGNESRTKSQWELYMESLSQGDDRVRYARLEQTVKHQQEQLREMALDRVKYARAEQLRTLQLTEGVDMDVAEELGATLHLDDAGFVKHMDKIKTRYRRDPSAIEPVRLAQFTGLGSPGGSAPAPESRMNHEQRICYSRALAATMGKIKQREPQLNDQELMAKARAETSQQVA